MLKKLINYIKNYDDINQLQEDYESLKRYCNKKEEENEYFKEKIRYDDHMSKNTEDGYYKLIERIRTEILQVQQYADKNIILKLKRILDETQQQIKNS